MSDAPVQIRQCVTIPEFDECIRLQREVFGLPDLEVSPRRHLIVSHHAGGWTLGAFQGSELVGFVHHLMALRGRELIGYSHMMAVSSGQQNRGLGARLKWAQRERALSEGVNFIKWTWDPMQARNAYFNLQRLGVVVRSYAVNYYGTDYATGQDVGLDSDRLFAEWELETGRVSRLAAGQSATLSAAPVASIEIPPDWRALVATRPEAARLELLRVRHEFNKAFSSGLVCAGFTRDAERPRYLLYRAEEITGAF